VLRGAKSVFQTCYGSPFQGNQSTGAVLDAINGFETLVMVWEGLLARRQDGQQASIHIDIDTGVGKVGFQ
jgi:hypothetical protein